MDLRETLRLVGTVLLIAILVPFVVYAVPAVVGADHSFVVVSGSMQPSIAPGDVVIVDGVSESETSRIETGDVITYSRSNESAPITHKVVDVERTGSGTVFVARGTANENSSTERVQPGQIIGEVTLVIPYIGYVIVLMGTRMGFAALVGIAVFGLLGSEAARYLQGSDDDEDAGDELSRVEATDADADASGDAAQPDAGEADDELTITRTDLQLTLSILVPATIYAVFVAWRLVTGWAIGIAVAAVGLTLGCLGIYLTTTEEEPTSTTEVGAADRVRAGRISEEALDLPRYAVDSVAALVELAAANDRWVIRDPVYDAYFVTDGRVVYVHEPGRDRILASETDLRPAEDDGEGELPGGFDPESFDEDVYDLPEGAAATSALFESDEDDSPDADADGPLGDDPDIFGDPDDPADRERIEFEGEGTEVSANGAGERPEDREVAPGVDDGAEPDGDDVAETDGGDEAAPDGHGEAEPEDPDGA